MHLSSEKEHKSPIPASIGDLFSEFYVMSLSSQASSHNHNRRRRIAHAVRKIKIKRTLPSLVAVKSSNKEVSSQWEEKPSHFQSCQATRFIFLCYLKIVAPAKVSLNKVLKVFTFLVNKSPNFYKNPDHHFPTLQLINMSGYGGQTKNKKSCQTLNERTSWQRSWRRRMNWKPYFHASDARMHRIRMNRKGLMTDDTTQKTTKRMT